LGSRRSFSIGLVFSQATSSATAHPIFPEMIGAISDYLDEENYTLTLFSQARHPERGVLQALAQGKVDGVILPDVRAGDELVNQLSLSGFPFVVIGQRYSSEEISWVDTNHDELVDNLTELLINQGHRRIAFINGAEEFSASRLRARGFQTAMGKRDLPVDPSLILGSEYAFATGHENTLALLGLPDAQRPSAIVAGSDLIAVGCLKAAAERGLRVPQDLAVTGFDDNPIAQFTQPPLTTVRAPISEMGATAARFILSLLDQPPGGAQQLILPGQIVPRESSG
jgi:LacI family transcriptional regulator